MTSQRVLHFTFTKCGSQWVRDVLAAPEVSALTGVTLDGRSPAGEWPEQAANTVLSPIYSVSAAQWKRRAEADMKAVVVLRDPRDRMVSWVFSFGYSHVREGRADLLQHLIPTLTRRQQILFGMFEFARVVPVFASWHQVADLPRTLLTTYEALVEKGPAEFERIMRFLEWPVPREVIDAVTERLSFEKRSGRQRGEADIFSHYRKGMPGDWRNYLNRELGRLFEEQFPGLLMAAGYEQTNDWWQQLPEELEAVAGPTIDLREVTSLKAELARLREERDELARGGKELEAELARLREEQDELARGGKELPPLREECDESLRRREGQTVAPTQKKRGLLARLFSQP